MTAVNGTPEQRAAARERNRRDQAKLREQRRASRTRLTVWLPHTIAQDFRDLADALDLTHEQLLSGMIRDSRSAVFPQQRLE